MWILILCYFKGIWEFVGFGIYLKECKDLDFLDVEGYLCLMKISI